MKCSSWLNSKRVRDYPRLFFVVTWLIILLDFLAHDGWIGGLTKVSFAADFISNYVGGLLYRTDIGNLYDQLTQVEAQTSLIAPYHVTGTSPFISPPYAALAYSWLTFIPLSTAFVLWQILNVLCVVLSVILISKFILPRWLAKSSLSPLQLSIILLSSFAFLSGFLVGQSHGITLLLFTGVVVAVMKEKWVLAGLLGSISIYKPQFVVGFLICWLVWGCFKALLSFGVLTLLWQIPVLLTYGLAPYLDYLKVTRILLYLPYAEKGYTIYYVTPYALVATWLPMDLAEHFLFLFTIFGISYAAWLAFVAWRSRREHISRQYFTLSLALLFPLLIAPHVLVYDLLILAPLFALLANYEEIGRPVKALAIFAYTGMLILIVIGQALEIALLGVIPLIILVYLVRVYFRSNGIEMKSYKEIV